MALITNTRAFDSKSNKFLNTHRAAGQREIGDVPVHLAITTTNINVYSNDMRIGFVQSMSPSESRTITKVQELGTEGVVQAVPGNTQGGQISISRFAVYNSNLWNALGLTPTGKFTQRENQRYSLAADRKDATVKDYNTYGNPFRTLKDQRVPLEIKTKTVMPDEGNASYYVETYIDCWLSSYSKTIAANTITITEQATIQYADVFSSTVVEKSTLNG